MQDINYINTYNYIITPDLQDALESGLLPHRTTNKIEKKEQGIYLVMFRVLNNNEKTLVYNYMYYPYLFCICLLFYLVSIRNVKHTPNKEVGNNLIVVDELFDLTDNGKFDLTSRNIYWEFLYNSYPIDQLKLMVNCLNRISCYSDISGMSELLQYAFFNDYTNFAKIILSSMAGYPMENMDGVKNSHWAGPISFMNSTLFIVHDLEMLQEAVRNRGFYVNKGPQRLRGQINSMNHALNAFDVSFRNSLYHHHIYHTRNNKVPTSLSTCRSQLSFNNIHINLGSVRWYGTQNSIRNVINYSTKR